MSFEIEQVSEDSYVLLKEGRKFGEVQFWAGHDKPMVSYSTPPGLTPSEEQQIQALRNPYQ